VLRRSTPLLVVACALVLGCSSEPAGPRPRVVIIADTHVIGPQYTTPVENSPADNESILLTPMRLRALRDQVNAMQPKPEAVFVLGDVVHASHHSTDLAWYDANRNAYTEAREIFAGFDMPVHVVMGNHDYEMTCGHETYPKALSEELFRHFFGAEPYYAVEVGGFRFYLLNGQQGPSWDPAGAGCDTEIASFGAAQLGWLARELDDGKPSVVMSHYMSILWAADENPGVAGQDDLRAVIRTHRNVLMALAGHTHRWLDFTGLSTGNSHLPHFVLGPARYDPDNFWTLELDRETGTLTIVDKDKAIWSSTCSTTYRYDGDPAPGGGDAAGTCVSGPG